MHPPTPARIRSRRRPLVAAGLVGALALTPLTAPLVGLTAGGANAADPGARPDGVTKVPTQKGYGGAVSSVDDTATNVGLQVLKDGGNAVDAAVATAAALGVTEPYSAGIGGGGYFVYYDARTGEVHTLDGRETAPATMPRDAFIDPETGEPYNFTPELVTSGVSVGTPGTAATWAQALAEWGSLSLGEAIAPATKVAQNGFMVDDTFRQQTLDNRERFDAFTSTRKLYLPGGDAPKVGTVFRNPDLARTYRLLADRGVGAFYTGSLAREMATTVQQPPKTASTDLPVPPGYLSTQDLRDYQVKSQAPTRISYRGYDVYGMAPSSSGGSTVGEALNILEKFDIAAMSDADALHHYLEAGSLAFADRGAYVGDPAYTNVPIRRLLDDTFAAERACNIDPDEALTKPTGAGSVKDYDGQCEDAAAQPGVRDLDTENISTTNLTVADKWGNVVEYTLTIEQTGGSGIVVPGRGFLLNNELTDFSPVWVRKDPNRIEPGKRPRSSMSPTIVMKDGKPFVALGSPGGSTIITTVLQMLFNRIDRGMSIEEAIAAPRSSPRNTDLVSSEPAFLKAYRKLLRPYGHHLVPSGDAFTSAAEIGAATAIEFGPRGLLTAVAEPTRRGGGAARVVSPR